MNQPAKKTINIESTVVVKKSQGFKKITHKANAGLSEAEAIERFTIGNVEDDGQEEKEKDGE